MTWILSAIFSSVGLFLIWLSKTIKDPNNYSFISGFNQLSKEDQIKYGSKLSLDISKLLKILGILFIATALISLFFRFVFPDLIDLGVLTGSSAVLFFVGCFLLKKKNYPSLNRIVAWVLGVFMISGSISIPYFYFESIKEPRVVFLNDSLKIDSVYGTKIPLADITKVELTETPLSVKIKVNGFAGEKIKRGKFKMANRKKAFLYVESENGPFVNIISVNNDDIYIGLKSRDSTLALYHKINAFVAQRSRN